MTPNSQHVIAGGIDGALHTWNLVTGKNKPTQTDQKVSAHAIAITPDGRRAVTVESGGTLKVLNLETSMIERTLTGNDTLIWALAITPDGRQVVFSGVGGLQVWNLNRDAGARKLTNWRDKAGAIAVTSDGQRVVSGNDDGTIRMWDVDTGRELGRVALDAAVTCVTIASGSPPLVVAGDAAGGVYCLEWVE
jgi:WD40 repeat protein